MALLLEVQNLHVAHQGEAGKVPVLHGVDVSLQAGETLGIVGESGSGKTVLIRAMLGLLRPPWRIDAGRVLFDGQDLLTKSEDELRAIRGRVIALTTPEPRKHLNPLLRVGKQIVNVIRAHSDAIARRRASPRRGALAARSGSRTRSSVCPPIRTS